MTIGKEHMNDAHFALKFLIDANITAKSTIGVAPEEYIQKHIQLIERLNFPREEENIKLKINDKTSKRWKHKSVQNLLLESKSNDPVEEIKKRARRVVLEALDKGWNGPPYSAIELAKLLNYDISPNDSILDARTIPIENHRFCIEYNPFQKPTRMNFSIAHEIAHTLFTDCHEEIRNREDQPDDNRELEQLCNIGAAELQLPYVIFPSDANDVDDISWVSLTSLAQRYKSSLESLLIAFVQSVDRSCAVMMCTFQNQHTLTTDYHKVSSRFKIKIPDSFVLPNNSRAYYCTAPGWSESETVKWDFLNEEYDIFSIGVSPMRKENKPRVALIMVPNNGRENIQNRKINIQYGDATKPRGQGVKIIAQVVNTSGGLGLGFGKSLSKNYPEIKDALKTWKENKPSFRLGNSQLVKVKHDTYVLQMLAQNGLFAKNGKIPLDYSSLQLCLSELRDHAVNLNADVYMPLIGAGMAKGKWEIIEGLIYSELVNRNVKVNIYLWGNPKVNDFKPKSSLSLFNEESTWQKE